MMYVFISYKIELYTGSTFVTQRAILEIRTKLAGSSNDTK